MQLLMKLAMNFRKIKNSIASRAFFMKNMLKFCYKVSIFHHKN